MIIKVIIEKNQNDLDAFLDLISKVQREILSKRYFIKENETIHKYETERKLLKFEKSEYLNSFGLGTFKFKISL